MPSLGSGGRKHKFGQARFTPARIAWWTANGNEMVLYDARIGAEKSPEQDNDDLKGHTVYIHMRHMRNPLRLALAHYTTDELQALREFFDYTFDKALQVAEELDAEARQAMEENDEHDFARLYRQPPVLVIRERDEREHDPGVPGGPEGVPGVAAGEPDDGAADA